MKNLFRYFNYSYWYRRFLLSNLSNLIYKKKDYRKKIFRTIYSSNFWRDYKNPSKVESKSGFGSDLPKISKFIESYRNFITENNISSILDFGCGDFIYMNEVLKELPNVKYTGMDIVESIIDSNNKKYSNENIKFKVIDAVEEDVEGSFDLVMSRFVMIHLDNSDNERFLNKLKNIESKFIALTSAPSLIENYDLKKTGKYRDVNLKIAPYNLIDEIKSITDIRDLKKNQDMFVFYKTSEFKKTEFNF